MTLPAQVTICGYPYTVEVVGKESYDEGEMCGDIDYFKQLLRISKDQPVMHERAVLLHEIIHGIAMHTGQHELRHNENYIDALAYSLLTLLRGNPDLVKYLTE